MSAGQISAAPRRALPMEPVRVSRWIDRRPVRLLVAALVALGVIVGIAVTAQAAQAAPGCSTNAIVCENALPGTPADQWDITGAGDDSIQGFATQMSVNVGESIDFKIDTDATAYGVQIFRLGWYQGLGARKIADVTPSAALPQTQPACATDLTTEIYDCGTWGVSASWTVPNDGVSGVYIALLTRADTGGRSQIPFVVRDDSSRSDAVFQTSDASWQAYNMYGGSDFYAGKANGRAFKISYNRPFITRGSDSGRDYLFANEYPMLRFLERNGYDMSYISSLDTDIRGANLKKHKIFISTGHDEYWSQGQRDNVEAARDAGVNLAFFSGNEVYWRTRWEPSQDGSNTANRTLVCYKDTWADKPLDPQGPTSTWRDARGAGEPENALTGTIYKANNSDLPITVSGVEGRMRLWRNTTLATQSLTGSTALAKHTVGYESDEDLDNGFRPAGLFQLSTTVGQTPQYLTDFGRTVVPATTTHHLTMYKASSGALVFGAGTVQWAWGLDTNHDGTSEPVDVRMQQAMINLFADMSAQPASLSTPGLVGATKSADTTAPTATIVTPAATTALSQGASITVSGTATDTGGQVAGVEVSIDAGKSWHPATGRTSWSYTGVLTGSGANAVQVRAVDDSGNLQSAVSTLATAVTCPCTIFGATVPGTAAVTDSAALTLGVRFTATTNGYVTGIRFYKGAGNTGTHTGTLYAADGSALATVTFADETATGWQTATFSAAVAVTAGTTYVAAYTAPNGHYAADSWYFGYAGVSTGLLSADGGKKPNGVYALGSAFPNATYNQTNYWVDVVFSLTDPTPLTVMATTPLNGAGSIATGAAVTAKLTRDPVVNTVAVTVKSAAGQSVTGATSYDAATRTVTFTPAAPLAVGTTYTATVNATPLASGITSKPASWSFTTARAAQVAGVCPCSLYDETDTPDVAASDDTASVELGTAFSSDTAGQITGIEFYKGLGNGGNHSVSLWSADGDKLATATATNETTVGWQTASFDKPVDIKAGLTYIASYRAPQGRYSVTSGAYAAATDRAPLHTKASAGRYSYSGGAPLNASSASYFVDPVFTVSAANPPTVAAVSPANKTTSTPVNTSITVTFDGTVRSGTAVITVKDSAGTAVAGTTANQTVGTTATFTPAAPLAAGKTYTVTVSGAKNLGGTAMTDSASSTFTTSGSTACPCTLVASSTKPVVSDANDAGPITVGTRFSSDVDGYVIGLRYWRDAANTGSHTGALFTADGQKLAGVTFADSGTGWQSAQLDTPVAITAGTSYVVAVFMPNGHYAAASDFFANAVVNAPLTGTQGLYVSGADAFPTASYRNTFYYVDPVFSLTDDLTAPKISAVKANAADGQATITWTTDEAASSTVSYGTSADKLTSTGTGADAVTAHTVNLNGLTVGKTYSFAVTSADAAGNLGTSEVATFTVADATAPVISGVAVTSSGGSATITWTTDESASGSIAYGTSADKLSSTVDESATGTSHSVKITGLTVGTTYSYRITSADKSGNATSAPVKTAAPASWTQKPVVVVKTVNDTDSAMSYTGSWYRSAKRGLGDYNDDVTATTANGASLTYSFTGVSVALITEMFSDQGTISVSIDGGTAKTVDTTSATRKVQQTVFTSGDLSNGKHTIKVTKINGTYMVVDAFAVGTVDTTAPVISSVAASGLGTNATVSWKTDEAASTSVAYGTSAAALTSVATGDDSTTNHTVNLDGLRAGVTYYYKATSVDVNGNASSSAVGSFAPVVPSKTLNDDDAAITYGNGTWKRSAARGYGDLKDDVTYATANNATATFAFNGTAVTMLTEKYSDMGYAQVQVDNGSAKLVNLYSSSRQVQQAVFAATGLSAGNHTVKITKLSGTYLLVDGFTITPSA